MSAVSTFDSFVEAPAQLGRVIDLAAERRRRQPLEDAMGRHPAGKARSAEPTRYVVRVPLYAKVVGWFAALAIVLAAGSTLGTAMRTEYSGPTHTHVVTAGQSVWGLAASVGSSRALEDVVEDIWALNQLDDATLLVGSEIILPTD